MMDFLLKIASHPESFWVAAALVVCLAVYLIGWANRPWSSALAWLVMLVSSAGLVLFKVADSYTGAGFNEAAWFHLTLGRRGLTTQLLAPFLFLAATIALAVGALGLLFWRGYKSRSSNAKTRPAKELMLGGLVMLSLAVNPGVVQAWSLAYQTLNQDGYRAEIAQAMAPVDQGLVSSTRKSLVLIYGESLERTFITHPDFVRFTPGLQRLAKEAIDIQGIGQAPFASWTIAGQAASQCGYPALSGEKTMKKHSASDGGWCLTDILASQGYDITYMNGANLEFGAKDIFWEEHQASRMLGTNEVKALADMPGAPLSEWGVHDDVLFPAALKELDRLESGASPYALILLTLDTHTPPMPSPSCENIATPPSDNEAVRTLACEDVQLTRFITQVRQKVSPNTLVVLISDHLRPRVGKMGTKMPVHADSENLALFWGTGLPPQSITRRARTFDLFPTLLSLLGHPSRPAHLGRDLLDETTPTLTEQKGSSGFDAAVRSAFMRDKDGFWTFDNSDRQP